LPELKKFGEIDEKMTKNSHKIAKKPQKYFIEK
jgi:hypothetical protein